MADFRSTDTLANERTFLAYVRTALAFIGFGFVIARFALFTREVASIVHVHSAPSNVSVLFGTLMALVGIAFGAYGSFRYIAGARAIAAGRVSVMPEFAAVAGGALIAAIGIAVVWTLLTTG